MYFAFWKLLLETFNQMWTRLNNLKSDVHANSFPQCGTRRGDDFTILRFYHKWTAFDLLGFYQELEIRLKPPEMVIFGALHEK